MRTDFKMSPDTPKSDEGAVRRDRREKIEPRKVDVQKDADEVVADVMRRCPVIMARLAE